MGCKCPKPNPQDQPPIVPYLIGLFGFGLAYWGFESDWRWGVIVGLFGSLIVVSMILWAILITKKKPAK